MVSSVASEDIIDSNPLAEDCRCFVCLSFLLQFKEILLRLIACFFCCFSKKINCEHEWLPVSPCVSLMTDWQPVQQRHYSFMSIISKLPYKRRFCKCHFSSIVAFLFTFTSRVQSKLMIHTVHYAAYISAAVCHLRYRIQQTKITL